MWTFQTKRRWEAEGNTQNMFFCFDFALYLNKQFLTALFSKPTFSQLLSGTRERESNTRARITAHLFYSAIPMDVQAMENIIKGKQ